MSGGLMLSGTGVAEELVDSDATKIYSNPTLTLTPLEIFVVAYTTDTDQDVKEGSAGAIAQVAANALQSGVFAQTYTVSSNTVSVATTQLLVNETTLGSQENASVALLDDNTYVVVWEGEGSAEDESGSVVDDAHGVFKNTFDLFSRTSLQADGEQFLDSSALTGTQKCRCHCK